MRTLQDEFSAIEIGPSAAFRNLVLFPLFRAKAPLPAADYLLLEDGIAEGTVRITELNAGGSVPELRLENNADLPVLLIDGEELVGAKQNRVLNLTILAAAKHSTVIPVSCVEAGRWKMSSAEMASANHVMYSGLRHQRMTQVTESMRLTGTRRSDQGAIWQNIADKVSRLRAASPTGAMSAIYERHASSVEEFLRAFTCQENQSGVAFAIDGRVLGLEMFDRADIFRRFFPKLIRSYALDALDAPSSGATASVEHTCALVTRLSCASTFVEDALGLGKDVRLDGPQVSGAALFAQERYVHICAFEKNGSSSSFTFGTRMTRPSHRRGFWPFTRS